jgi:hypothetical protein
MAKVTMKQKKERLAEVLNDALEAKTITAELADTITGIFGSQSNTTKVNEDGQVFCTYFGEYLPAEDFHTSTKGKIDSMSLAGKRLHRTQKSMVNKATNEVLKQFRAKEINAAEMEELLAAIDANASHKFPIGTESISTDYPFSI